MTSFELNKIAGAFLGALVLALGLSAFSGELFRHSRIDAAEHHAAVPAKGVKEAAASASSAVPLADRLAVADASKGAAGTKACRACHSLGRDGATKSGPPLYGIVERRIGSVPGFAYSEAMKEKTGNWTFEALDEFLADPKAYASGTKMTYAGERDPAKRADLIAFLDSLTDNPRPLPGKNAMKDAE